ncbi:MAG: hypothetical protein O2807_10965, partial [bacterium]|nr:hypothetical protein [bacterium]
DVPDGTGFDIYRLESLKAAHRAAGKEDCEHVSRFIKRNLEDFSINLVAPPEYLRRPDLRFTVDYPEDLIFCRAAYRELRGFAPLIPLKELIAFADAHPELTALVAPYSAPALPWKIRKEDGQ